MAENYTKESKKAEKKPTTENKTKGKNPEITDNVKVDFEPNLRDMDNLDEQYMRMLEDENFLAEVLSIGARLKKRQQIRRFRSKMKIARSRSMRRKANTSRISTRARRSALGNVKRKLAGGRSAKDMTYSERARIERLASRRKAMVNRQVRRIVIKKRAIERNRLSKRR